MQGIVEAAVSIMGASERRLEVVAQNVANSASAGYKRQVAFNQLVDSGPGSAGSTTAASAIPAGVATRIATAANPAQGTLTRSSNLSDLAITGDGSFIVRDGEQRLLSRDGGFTRTADGTLTNGAGQVLQQLGGGDLVLDAGPFTVTESGIVLQGGGDPIEIAAGESGAGQIRQSMNEGSNVVMGDEMVAMMATIRQAENGARLVQVYDDLMSRLLTTLGQGAR
jgi:flagellar basal-body rod protein FlgF